MDFADGGHAVTRESASDRGETTAPVPHTAFKREGCACRYQGRRTLAQLAEHSPYTPIRSHRWKAQLESVARCGVGPSGNAVAQSRPFT